MTENTFRTHALPFLKEDFGFRCAYCMRYLGDEKDLELEIDHFNSALKEAKRNQYKNMMLACGTCNRTKAHKLVADPQDKEFRLLNCTEENEFPEHIVEGPDGTWKHVTKAGFYHLTTVDLNHIKHVHRRLRRSELVSHVRFLYLETALKADKNSSLESYYAAVKEQIDFLRNDLEKSVLLVTDSGVHNCLDVVMPKHSDALVSQAGNSLQNQGL